MHIYHCYSIIIFLFSVDGLKVTNSKILALPDFSRSVKAKTSQFGRTFCYIRSFLFLSRWLGLDYSTNID